MTSSEHLSDYTNIKYVTHAIQGDPNFSSKKYSKPTPLCTCHIIWVFAFYSNLTPWLILGVRLTYLFWLACQTCRKICDVWAMKAHIFV